MKSEFRNRAFLPVLLPIAILLAMAAFIGLFALTLLNSTHEASLTLAAVTAGAILFAISLAANQERLDAPRRAVLVLVVLVPFGLGGAYAAGVIGDIPAEAKMINVAPPAEAPEDAILAAESSDTFCLPDPESEECEPTDEWVASAQDAEEFLYAFDNREEGVAHNLSIDQLEGDASDPSPGERLNEGEVITGPDEVTETVTPGLEPGEYYFVCDLHAADMNGVLEITEGGGEDAEGA